jgi:predicted nucleic acid-binding Zn ribbon protein
MTNKAKAFATLDTFADSRVALIQGMKDAGYTTLEACKPIVIEWACNKVGVGEKGYRTTESGKVVLISTLKQSSSIRTSVNDVMLMLQGTTRRKAAKSSNKTSDKTDPVEAVIKAMLQLTPAQRRAVIKAVA